MLEWHIIQRGRLHPNWQKEQRELIKLRLERAELEVRLYAQAIAADIESLETEPACESVPS